MSDNNVPSWGNQQRGPYPTSQPPPPYQQFNSQPPYPQSPPAQLQHELTFKERNKAMYHSTIAPSYTNQQFSLNSMGRTVQEPPPQSKNYAFQPTGSGGQEQASTTTTYSRQMPTYSKDPKTASSSMFPSEPKYEPQQQSRFGPSKPVGGQGAKTEQETNSNETPEQKRKREIMEIKMKLDEVTKKIGNRNFQVNPAADIHQAADFQRPKKHQGVAQSLIFESSYSSNTQESDSKPTGGSLLDQLYTQKKANQQSSGHEAFFNKTAQGEAAKAQQAKPRVPSFINGQKQQEAPKQQDYRQQDYRLPNTDTGKKTETNEKYSFPTLQTQQKPSPSSQQQYAYTKAPEQNSYQPSQQNSYQPSQQNSYQSPQQNSYQPSQQNTYKPYQPSSNSNTYSGYTSPSDESKFSFTKKEKAYEAVESTPQVPQQVPQVAFKKKKESVVEVASTIGLFKPTTQAVELEAPKEEKRGFKKSDFKIGKKMGKGQFGEVLLVQHKATGFICGMKVMEKKQIRDEDYVGQIARELSIQFYLSHRNIAPLYGYFSDENNVYLLVEFCTEGQLLQKLRGERRMQEGDVAAIMKQVCEGVDYIHKEQIIHRDIKPENILFNYGVVKISDFGWAVYRGFGMRKTASGSPLYYPPEIVKGEEYDDKIDVWNIGMMTYECILGKIPFRIYTEMDLNRIVSDEITFPEWVDVTDTAKDFILKTMRKKGDERMTIKQMMRHPFLSKSGEKQLEGKVLEEFRQVLN